MIEIPKYLKDALQCSKCKLFLSVGPIVLDENGTNICGRCQSDYKQPVNKSIEAVLQEMKFPCRYKEKGCAEVLQWANVEDHEMKCPLKTDTLFATQKTELFKALKCDNCAKYMTVEPLYMTNNGENICGRCVPLYVNAPQLDIKLRRNYALEEMMKTLQLPCIYSENGCTSNLRWGEVAPHEDFCPKHSFQCPATPFDECLALVTEENIETHFQKEHSKLLLSSLKFVENVSVDCDMHRLINVKNYLLLVMTKVRVKKDRLWFGICHVGENTKQLKYKLKISNIDETEGYTSRQSIIETNKLKRLNEKSALAVVLPSLFVELELKKLGDVIFNVLITPEEEPSE